jgi:hypothetical protein
MNLFFLRSLDSFAYALVFLFILGDVAYAQTWKCPDDMPHEKNSGQYSFKFNSWKLKTEHYAGRFSICHCIKNTSNINFFVDWEGTSTTGTAIAGMDTFTIESFDAEKFKTEKNDIWFGASPERVTDVDTYVFDPTIVAQDESPSFYRSETSVGAIVNNLSLMQDKADLAAASADSSLVDTLAMTFEAQLNRDTGKVDYSCVYTVRPGSPTRWDSSYFVGFDNPDLNQIMFGGEGPIAYSRQVFYGFTATENRKLEASTLEDGTLVIEIQATMVEAPSSSLMTSSKFQIASESGLVAASMPVSFWSSSGQ